MIIKQDILGVERRNKLVSKMNKINNYKLNILPKHVAIIMDGNGRWAQSHNKNRIAGHEEGAHRVREIVEFSRSIEIPYLTLYAFSHENWRRPKLEVNALMYLLRKYLKKEKQNMIKNNIALDTIGDLDRLPKNVQEVICEVKEATYKNHKMVLNLALSYGGRVEIIEASKSFTKECLAGNVKINDLNEDTYKKYLYTNNMPDPDIVIRTGGEKRISNFLPWQCVYSELFFIDKPWPEFKEQDFYQILNDFQSRERRFGGIKPN